MNTFLLTTDHAYLVMWLLGCNIAHFKNKRHQLLGDNGLLQLIVSQFIFLLDFILHHFSNFIQMKHAIYLLIQYLDTETFSLKIIWLYCLLYILYFYEIILIYLIFSMFCSAIYVRLSVEWRAPQQVAGTSIYLATSPPTCNAATCLLYYNGKVTYNFALQKLIWQYYLIFIWSPKNPGPFSMVLLSLGNLSKKKHGKFHTWEGGGQT